MFILGLAMLAGALTGYASAQVRVVMAIIGLVIAIGTPVLARRQPTAPKKPGELWWLGAALPFGLGTWATFLYLGLRVSNETWLRYAPVYFASVSLAILCNLAASDEGAVSALSGLLMFTTWIGGALHAYNIREEVRSLLDSTELASS